MTVDKCPFHFNKGIKIAEKIWSSTISDNYQNTCENIKQLLHINAVPKIFIYLILNQELTLSIGQNIWI